ncbi:MAG: nickel-binding protein [Nitrososphaeraceae archaeon]
MPKFIDSHLRTQIDEKVLQTAIDEPVDEFGVKVERFFYNIEAGVIFCILDAPNEQAVFKHHEKYKVKCEMIYEIKEI